MTQQNSREKQRQSSDSKPASTVEKILDAAEQLFAEQSYEGTSLREIAQKVKIREPSLYAHFSSKEAIYGAVIDRALEPFLNEINSWNKVNLSLHELLAIPRKMLQLHAQHPNAARIMHREFSHPVDRISPKVMEWMEKIAEQSLIFMTGLPENEHTRVDRRKAAVNIITLTNITLGFFSSQGMQKKLLGDHYDHDALFEEHVRIVTKIFKSLLI